MISLYDILEVSEKASKEVIEKAYRVLAKKYHPDLQTPENKSIAEAKMKEINDAYSVLSDENKRKEYDEKLLRERQEQEQSKRGNLQSYAQQEASNYQYYASENSQQEQRYRDMQRRKYEEQLKKQQEQMHKNMQEQYENAYYNYLRSLGYRIKEKWTWKKTKQLLLTILIMIVIFIILWVIPPTHDIMVEFYESNKIVKIIVDIVWGTVKAIFQTIWEMISNIFK